MSLAKVTYIDDNTYIYASNLNDIQDEILNNETMRKCVVINVPSFSALPKTISDSRIKSDMVVVNYEIGTPSAMLSNWNWKIVDAQITITGTISGSTTMKLYLLPSR